MLRKPPCYSLHLTKSLAIIRETFKSPKCRSFETYNSAEATLKSCDGDYSISYCAGYCLRQATSSRLIKFSQPSAEWATFCLHPYPKHMAVMCSNIYDCQSNYREKPLNGKAKEQRRNRKEERPKKSLPVLTPYQQTFPIPSNRGRKRIRKRRKWGAHARP